MGVQDKSPVARGHDERAKRHFKRKPTLSGGFGNNANAGAFPAKSCLHNEVRP
jgi:hypothetical protein